MRLLFFSKLWKRIYWSGDKVYYWFVFIIYCLITSTIVEWILLYTSRISNERNVAEPITRLGNWQDTDRENERTRERERERRLQHPVRRLPSENLADLHLSKMTILTAAAVSQALCLFPRVISDGRRLSLISQYVVCGHSHPFQPLGLSLLQTPTRPMAERLRFATDQRAISSIHIHEAISPPLIFRGMEQQGKNGK